jgi:hypothetical protein
VFCSGTSCLCPCMCIMSRGHGYGAVPWAFEGARAHGHNAVVVRSLLLVPKDSFLSVNFC